MKQFKPMLASECTDLHKLQLPVYISRKLDGIRTLSTDQFVSRSLKPIRNKYIQSLFKPEFYGLDGELIVGDPGAKNVFQVSSSGIMSSDGEPDAKYYVFDRWNVDGGFSERMPVAMDNPFIVVVEQVLCHTIEEILTLEQKYLAEGMEGIMIRKYDGPYKNGRSSEREGYLLKRKPFADAEAEIIGFEELLHNANDATTNALGRTERSSHKENLVPLDTLGALVVKCDKFEETFKIGTGYDHATRKWIWDNRDSLIGKLVKFKYQEIGVKDKPRFPVFLGIRNEEDMS